MKPAAIYVATVLALALPQPAEALSAGKLALMCASEDPQAQVACTYYFMGAWDTWRVAGDVFDEQVLCGIPGLKFSDLPEIYLSHVPTPGLTGDAPAGWAAADLFSSLFPCGDPS